MDILTLIEYTSPKALWIIVFLFARILGAIMICPLFSSNYTSALLRTCLSLLFAMILYPWFKNIEVSPDIFANMLLAFSNTLYGSLLGYLLSLPIWLIESCGSIMDLQRGEQIGLILNQQTRNPSSSVSKLLTRAFITYLIVNNGMIFFFDIVFNSFILVAPNSLFPVVSDYSMKLYISLINDYCSWAVLLALPVIVILLLVDITISLISALIPQLNATVFSLPIKGMIAILILIFYCESLFHDVINKFIVQIKDVLT